MNLEKRQEATLYPSVHFAPDFVRRVERTVLHLAACRERREGAGSAALAGGGEEFIGYRPYIEGEDLRPIDWNLYARLDRPYVRVTRREAAEHWALLFDASASMAVGPPGKLQAAAEMVAALCAVGLRQGARIVVLVAVAGRQGICERRVRTPSDFAELLAFLEQLQAGGSVGLERSLAEWRPASAVGRLFLLGDLLDLEPSRLAQLRRRGRELFLLQFLAQHEFTPPTTGGVRWTDPETGADLKMELTPALCTAYQGELEQLLKLWRKSCAQHGIRYLCAQSNAHFEDLLPRLFGLNA